MGNRGGRRPGSGRKSKATNRLRREIAAATAEKLSAWLPGLLENMKSLADGRRSEDGQGYIVPPDRAANEYLVNRLLGKPADRKEIGGSEGRPVSVAFEEFEKRAERIYGEREVEEGSGD
jgi:hypothetical protein